jgi:hypothetical protein
MIITAQCNPDIKPRRGDTINFTTKKRVVHHYFKMPVLTVSFIKCVLYSIRGSSMPPPPPDSAQTLTSTDRLSRARHQRVKERMEALLRKTKNGWEKESAPERHT